MGAWGVGLLQDDLVCDIKDEYKVLLSYGVQPQIALCKTQSYFKKDLSDDEENLFWIAIAYVNWQCGINDEKIIEKAIKMLDDEKYMEVWSEQGSKLYNKRKAVIDKFKNDLKYNQRRLKKTPKPMKALRAKTAFHQGDLLAYKLGSTYFSHKIPPHFVNNMDFFHKWVLFRVIKIGACPVSRIMPELDYNSFACLALYDQLFDIKPNSMPSGLNLTKLVSRNLGNKRVEYDVMQLEESAEPYYDASPEMSIAGQSVDLVEWGEKGFSADYRCIDRTVIETISR